MKNWSLLTNYILSVMLAVGLGIKLLYRASIVEVGGLDSSRLSVFIMSIAGVRGPFAWFTVSSYCVDWISRKKMTMT